MQIERAAAAAAALFLKESLRDQKENEYVKKCKPHVKGIDLFF